MSFSSLSVRQATVEDTPVVTDLAQRLLSELGGFPPGEPAALISLCEHLLSSERYTALLAVDAAGTPLGLLTLNECPALYVAGFLGWIQEFYVVPQARSLGIGKQLMDAAIAYGRERGWKRLEVNTPDRNAWPRTVAFYRRKGFVGDSAHLRMPLI
jgi:GNAT superfamily N-acetyltransferase